MTKKRILVVDDEPSFTRVLKLYLEKTGIYDVRDENRGTMALSAAKEFQPDLILLDIVMPDKDGGEIASSILQDDALKDTPIVFLTAAVSKDEEGIISGRPFIAKPANAEEVVQCIEKNLAR
ncbi:MAG: response regulator [Deltaproteobacteria bacterium]|nr:response regulator [Deltaproteobacteria bacterium]